MRLLNTRTGQFRWVNSPAEVKYAVLSHVWSRDGEQSYQDLLRIQAEVDSKEGSDRDEGAVLRAASQKIRNACAHALANGLEHIWMDLCCTDKTSSAEVSDAVLSMYAWYAHAAVCYAYLADVEADEDPRLPSAKFRWSAWHTRGWTLPELIAPKALTFLAADWRPIGTRHELADVLEAVTGVDKGVLTHHISLGSIPVARRMAWAAKRLTTRKEDEAYALLGLFGVHMPIMYGEGAHAFIRLQEGVLKATGDQSLFVWNADASDCVLDAEVHDETRHTLLASSPASFARSSGVQTFPWDDLLGPRQRARVEDELPTYEFTPHGIRTSFPLLSVGPNIRLGLLSCADEDGGRLALVLKKAEDAAVYTVGTAGWEEARTRYRASLRTLPWGTALVHGDEPPRAASDDRFMRVVKLVKPWPKTVPVSRLCVVHGPPYAVFVHPRSAHLGPAEPRPAREHRADLIRVDWRDSSLRGVLWGCFAGAVDAVVSLLVIASITSVAIVLLWLVLPLSILWPVRRHPHL